MSTENMSAVSVLATIDECISCFEHVEECPDDTEFLAQVQRMRAAVAAMAEREAALIVRLKALESEVSARRSGWVSFVDDEDPSLLVVAHHDRSVHFTGTSAWDDANAFDAARAEAGHG